MRIEPDSGEGVDDFVVVEDGEYSMRVGGVKETRDSDDRVSWMLRMELTDGDRAGRTAVTDWLNFSTKGMHRARLVLSALGFDTSVGFEIQTHELIGREALIRIRTEETLRPEDGRLQRRSRVPYDGWAPSVAAESGVSAGGRSGLAADAMPF